MANIPDITTLWLTPDTGRPLLVVGPSLGTAVTPLWDRCAGQLAHLAEADVLGWELPGHGQGAPTTEPYALQELAAAVAAAVEQVRPGTGWVHAGVSVGGATGLHLALAGKVRGSAVLCSGPKLGTPESWAERAATVREHGTAVMVDGSRQRWFAPGFTEREPDVAERLLGSLREADAESYAQVCGALGRHDVREDLAQIDVPVLLLGGADDAVAPPQLQEATGSGIPGSTVVVLDDVAHLAPAEDPVATAEAIAAWWPGG